MTNPVIEQVARALCEASPLNTHRDNGARAWKRYIPQARAALQALKDNVSAHGIITSVHENMVSNGYDISPAAVTKAVKSVITHIMIDTAMKEETE